MKPSFFRMSLIAVAAPALVFATVAAAQTVNAPPSPAPGWMQHWSADHEALLDAKLGGLKAGLRLNPEQEKLWAPFEAAVREVAELRMRHMASRMEMMHGGGGPGMMGPGMMGPDEDEGMGGPGSPIDRLEAMANRMTEGAAVLKKVVDAAKPLYASLDDTQKRDFGFLTREMMMLGHGRGGMGWGHGGMGPGQGGAGWGHPGWGPHHMDEDQGEED